MAAGQSKRMGQPKQLLLYQNKPLIRHVLDEILATGTRQVIVVLGAYAEAIGPGDRGALRAVCDQSSLGNRHGGKYPSRSGRNAQDLAGERFGDDLLG